MQKRCLYLLHTDWRWIKQRSQFLAEHLTEARYEVDVCYKLSPRRGNLVRNQTKVRLYGLPLMPFGWRVFKLLRHLDIFIWRTFLTILQIFRNYDVAIVTHPLLFSYTKWLDVPVVYDLHDDNAEFYDDGKLKSLIASSNFEALSGAAAVVFSSNYLANKYKSFTSGVTRVVRNGHKVDSARLVLSPVCSEVRDSHHMVYFGSISAWFDMELVIHVLDAVPTLRMTVIGPADRELPSHPRLDFTGPMDHAEMLLLASTADFLIMPFKITPLILGVDPVKLYEYLSFPVPVFSVNYPELEHFGDLVTFYSDVTDLAVLIENVIAVGAGISEIEIGRRRAFLERSHWSTRVGELAEVLEATR